MDDSVPKSPPPQFRFDSARAYRLWMNRVAHECYTGKRPMADLPRAAALAKTGVELLMTEITLAQGGLDRAPETSPLGTDGGLRSGEPGLYVEKVVTRKEGIGPKGTPVEEDKVQRTSGESEAFD